MTVPAVWPVTMPELMSTVALAALLLDHTPPEVVLNKAEVVPAHIIGFPVIVSDAAREFTETTVETELVQPNELVIV